MVFLSEVDFNRPTTSITKVYAHKPILASRGSKITPSWLTHFPGKWYDQKMCSKFMTAKLKLVVALTADLSENDGQTAGKTSKNLAHTKTLPLI